MSPRNPFTAMRARLDARRQRDQLLVEVLTDLDKMRSLCASAGSTIDPADALVIVHQAAADAATRLRRLVGGTAVLILVALSAAQGCAVDPAGLGHVDGAGGVPPAPPPSPEPHPEAAPPEHASAEVDATSSPGSDGPAESSTGESPAACVAALDPRTYCDRCRDHTGADLSALCRSALACLGTAAAWSAVPVVGGPPDPLSYCTSSQPVAACLQPAVTSCR